ncbi:DUF5123 domain-containing protein [Bacteroides sp.]|uniref:DUF5123 domain-containing protein n=1 Tax=Bacteroides sp. TaxID=29523 RepID=UPI0025C3F54A|nr:DUF5123 domain-containing protein [Bacteroides sp.]
MRNIFYSLAGIILLLGITACSEEERYTTSVVKDIELFLDDEPWNVNTNSSNKPLFIYTADGEYVANYSSLYRFQLANGSYNIISTTQSDSIPAPKNLNDVVINQDPTAKTEYAISAPVTYKSPFNEPLSVRMYNRTGVLRLKSTDRKSDKSYSKLRAVISSPISGYKLSDATFVKTQIEVQREKVTDTGGVNYTDDFVLFETQSEGKEVSVRIDYLDKNNTVIQSKPIDGAFTILPDDIVQVAFALNNVDEPVIQDYTVTIASEGWNEEDINPEAPMRIPDGYRYVSPEENLESICKSMLADASVNEVKLFLKAGASYKLGTQTEIPKALYIMGQTPGADEELTSMEMGNMSINCPDAIIGAFHFENLKIKVTTSDFFKFKNQAFHVSTFSWKNCEISDLGRTMWYQEVDEDQKQIVDNIVVEDCRFLGLNSEKSGLFGISTKKDAPVHNFVFRNSTFHAKNLSKALITGLSAMTGELNVTIENCTFVSMAPAGMTFFDLNPKNTSSFNLVVRNNLFSGVCEAGQGTWFTTRNITTKTFANNYRTNGFVVANWGVDAAEMPIEAALPMETLFKDVAGRDFTITDTNSEVYTNGIGDSYWIK